MRKSFLFLSTVLLAAALAIGVEWAITRHALAAPAVPATSFTVNNDGDDSDASPGDNQCLTSGGVCTLRAAIQEANAHAGADSIVFNIGPNNVVPRTIYPLSPLPPIVQTLSIDGHGHLYGIFLEGTSAGASASGLVFSAGTGSRLHGLTVLKFGGDGVVITATAACTITANTVMSNTGVGIRLATSNNIVGGLTAHDRNVISGNGGGGASVGSAASRVSGNIVRGNYIGTDSTGAAAQPNGYNAISLAHVDSCTIGGAVSGAGNVIAGNNLDVGISLYDSHYNTIQGNKIGTDASGTVAMGFTHGVMVRSSDHNLIGGTTVLARNLISGNHNAAFSNGCGVLLERVDAWGDAVPADNEIYGNYVGTDVNGTSALENRDGICVDRGENNLIGSAEAGAGNVIAGNRVMGIDLFSPDTSGTVIQGNRIGVAADGAVLGNGKSGIFVWRAGLGRFGGVGPGEANVIAFNGDRGIVIGLSSSNAILHNAVYSNASIGIDLVPTASVNPDGVTPNDAGDGDSGGNNVQNYPVLSGAAWGGGPVVTGTLNSISNTVFALDFYANDACDPSGYGEGEVYVGTYTVTTNASGNASFVAPVSQMAPFYTATATDPHDNTSEFSLCIAADETVPVLGVSIAGPTQGFVNQSYVFVAAVSLPTATLPITYTWSPAPITGQGTSMVTYNWPTPGVKTLTVTAQNAGGSATSAPATITIETVPVASVSIAGPTEGVVNQSYAFVATVSPPTATLPIVYTWSPAPASGQGTSAVTYNWPTPGVKTLTVTAQNAGGSATSAPATVTIYCKVYLPLVLRNY